MNKPNLAKTTLILDYNFGEDILGNSRITTQIFSSVKKDSDDSAFTAVGYALASLIDSDLVTARKRNLLVL